MRSQVLSLALALGAFGCMASVSDEELELLEREALADGELADGELADDDAADDDVGSAESELSLTTANYCWWDPDPQPTCNYAYGRVPTCPSCTSCLNCSRIDWAAYQFVRVQLNTTYYPLLANQLQPYVVVGVGTPSKATDWELLTIKPSNVIDGGTWVSVPARFHDRNDVHVWFVRDYGLYSLPLTGTLVPAP